MLSAERKFAVLRTCKFETNTFVVNYIFIYYVILQRDAFKIVLCIGYCQFYLCQDSDELNNL